MGLEIRNGLIVPNLKQFSMEIKPSVKTPKRVIVFIYPRESRFSAPRSCGKRLDISENGFPIAMIGRDVL